MRCLHIGGSAASGGWEVFNAIAGPHVDHIGNANDLSRFADSTFDKVYASHVLEHFDYVAELILTLVEWRRVLTPGGKLFISVPDLDTLARLILDRERLDVDARFMVMRMIFGGHTNLYDYHKVGLNEEFLVKYLQNAGYESIVRVPRLGFFADTSEMIFAGVPISLNIVAEKSSQEIMVEESPGH